MKKYDFTDLANKVIWIRALYCLGLMILVGFFTFILFGQDSDFMVKTYKVKTGSYKESTFTNIHGNNVTSIGFDYFGLLGDVVTIPIVTKNDIQFCESSRKCKGHTTIKDDCKYGFEGDEKFERIRKSAKYDLEYKKSYAWCFWILLGFVFSIVCLVTAKHIEALHSEISCLGCPLFRVSCKNTDCLTSKYAAKLDVQLLKKKLMFLGFNSDDIDKFMTDRYIYALKKREDVLNKYDKKKLPSKSISREEYEEEYLSLGIEHYIRSDISLNNNLVFTNSDFLETITISNMNKFIADGKKYLVCDQ